MSTLYHGTTLANWERIQVEGWNGDSAKCVWTCSEDMVYGYDLEKNLHEGGEDYCISQALSNATIAAAIQNYKGETLVVLRIEVDSELVQDDDSCPNMSGTASCVSPKHIKQENITGIFHSDSYCSSMRLFYVKGFFHSRYQNPYINQRNFTRLEKEMLRHIEDVEMPYEIYEYEWVEK